MNNTEKLDFKIYENESLRENSQFVEIRAGKGKKEGSSIYIDIKGFTFLEGLIWNKYREYQIYQTNKIKSSEWDRINQGLIKSSSALVSSVDINDLDNILKISDNDLSEDLNYLFKHKDELAQMLSDFVAWINKSIKKEKYITLIKSEAQ